MIQVVEGVAELLAEKAREKNLSMMTFIDPALPEHLIGDPTRLRQILSNLVGNAVKFTDQGEIVIRVALEPDRHHIRSELRDTGIGIAPDVQSRLFASFTQADSSTTRKYGGTGLGLAISKNLVEFMGGTMRLESALGVGSTFRFVLPLQASQERAATIHVAGLAGVRLLLADNQPFSREIIERYCQSWDMDVSIAEEGEKALAMIHEAAREGRPFDLVLIEMLLPGLDGIGLARTLRADKAYGSLKLIMLTERDRRQAQELAAKVGFDSSLSKPVRQSLLLDALCDVVSKPIEQQALPITEKTSLMDELHAAVRENRLILLAEDIPTNQKVAQLILRKLGYACHSVDNGQAALDAMGTLPYALILMDCQMPVMDGYEATRKLRQREAETGQPRLPVIALTANAMQGDREKCLNAGMDDYISKPVSTDKLHEVLARWSRRVKRQEDAVPSGQVDAVLAGAWRRSI